jgi:hypothetical protein
MENAFGNAIVVPLQDIFGQIQTQLSVTQVSLATSEDITVLYSQGKSRWVAEPIIPDTNEW